MNRKYYFDMVSSKTFKEIYDFLLLLLELDTVTQVQILCEAVCISHSADTLGKSMNPTIVPKRKW